MIWATLAVLNRNGNKDRERERERGTDRETVAERKAELGCQIRIYRASIPVKSCRLTARSDDQGVARKDLTTTTQPFEEQQLHYHRGHESEPFQQSPTDAVSQGSRLQEATRLQVSRKHMPPLFRDS